MTRCGSARRGLTTPGRGDREQAETLADKLLKPYGVGGIGIELGDMGDGRILAGVDLDTCRDEAGEIAPWAVEVIERFESYTELSPSGTGAKLSFLADPMPRPSSMAGDRSLRRGSAASASGRKKLPRITRSCGWPPRRCKMTTRP